MSGHIMSRIGHSPPDRNARTVAHERAPRAVVGFTQDYPDGFATEPHRHLRAQLLYTLSGVLRVATDDASYAIPPGTGLFIPAALPHAVRMDGPVAMRALFLRADAARVAPPRVTVIAVPPLLRELILAACAEPLDWDLKGRGRHLAALALDEIARAPSLPLALPVPRDPRLSRLTAQLRARPDEARSLDMLAAEAGASVRTLARLFRRETGMSFQQWRRQLRLTEAVALLAAGATPARAAASVGYASTPAFGAAIRAAFGVTPGGLRGLGSAPR
jgi:AraC-like DNA-binding protein/mannose-6-phosphate isomerase-like protein (cupin superfamily)